MSEVQFNGVKVFSATMMQDRQVLGEKVTEWMQENPECKIVDRLVTQSSDSQYHCITITLFYYRDPALPKKEPVNAQIPYDQNGSRGAYREAAGGRARAR